MHNTTQQVPTSVPGQFTDRAWYSRLILVVAIGLTGVGAVVLDRAIARNDAERFATSVAGIEAAITARVAICQALLGSTAGLLSGHDTLDRAGFAAFGLPLAPMLAASGIRELGWVVPVPPGSEAALQAWLSAQGHAAPRLWPEPNPGATRTAIRLALPDDRVVGFDLATGSNSAEVFAAAARTRSTQASGPLAPPFGPPSDDLRFLAVIPVFAAGNPQTLRGWAFAELSYRAFFAPLHADQGDSQIAWNIHDAADGRTLNALTGIENGALSAHRSIDVLGRTWNLEFSSTRAFEQGSSHWIVPAFTCAGLVLGFALFLLARSQGRAVARNAELYRVSTAARREAELSLDIITRLAATLDPKAVAEAVTCAGRELTRASYGAFFTRSGDDQEPAISALCGESSSQFSTHGLPQVTALLAATMAGQTVIRLPDARLDPRCAHSRPHAAEPNGPLVVASYLAVAVRSRTGDVLGGLCYMHSQPGRFTNEHERLLLDLSNQAALALDNARRFEAQIEAGHRAGHRVDDLNLANSELQQFIYVSSHDLQEPLRTITQYLDLLRRRHTSQLDDQARRYIAYASDSASRMYLLLNDLLTYSRLGHAAERTTVNLVDVVAEVVQDLRAVVAETHAKITLGDLPTVRCDRSMIRSLFQNLLGNAMKFRKDDAPHIMLSAQVDHAGLWTMSVADNGIGIRQEHRQAVFEVFHRLHDRDAFPGTGIGLAIARKVVEQHGGKIWIEETPHGGATFLFTLPEDGSGVRAAVEAA